MFDKNRIPLEKSYIENYSLKLVIDQTGKNYIGCQRGSASRHCGDLLHASFKPLGTIVMFEILDWPSIGIP